jgi:putative protein-disulfide isomerase
MDHTLHLITDPLCGWCFGAAPLVKASQKIPGLNIKLHFGGLFSTPNNRIADAAMQRFIMHHHERITQLTGQTPGPGLKELLDSGDAVLDSTPPIKALLAADIAGGNVIAFYQAIIKAHFMDGRRVADAETLKQIAIECGIEAEVFQQTFDGLSDESVAQHIDESRGLLQHIGGQGFPTFALEQEGQIQMLNHQAMYNNPDGWQQALEELMLPQVVH